MNVIPIPIIGMNTNTKEITENYRKLQKMKESIKGKNIDTMENIL